MPETRLEGYICPAPSGLAADPAAAILRRADARYDQALEVAEARGAKTPKWR